ncbi:MAG: metallophosphoesterase [Nanopusillaceae archaeon]
MKIAVTSDLHLPLNLKEFYEALKKIEEEIDIFIFAGDIVDRDNHIYFKKLYLILNEKFSNFKIISVFGNNESLQNREKYKREYNFMGWLEDNYVIIDDYCFLGTCGFPDLKKSIFYTKKDEILRKLEKCFQEVDKKIIFISHYSFCQETIKGDPGIPPALFSKELNNLFKTYKDKILLAFHGHAHFSKNWYYKLGNTEIYNVSFYIHKKPLIFELK